MPRSAETPPAATSTASAWWVVCLCAGWCGTCREYRALFDALAAAHPETRFEWVDIEDESELVADLEVETFPTLLIGQGGQARFLGALLPQAAVLGRLLASLQANSSSATTDPQAQEVLMRVQASRAG